MDYGLVLVLIEIANVTVLVKSRQSAKSDLSVPGIFYLVGH
jgi:hypothetical protein